MPKVTETILAPTAANNAGAALRARLHVQAGELERLLQDLAARRTIMASVAQG